MLLSPDSSQLRLGETDEENSTKPHVQPTLLPPSPTLYHSSLLLLFPLFPLSLRWKNGAPHSSTPPPFVALPSPLLSHTTAFSSPQPRVAAFLPPLSVSLLCFTSFLSLRVTSGMTDPWQEKSWQTAGVLQREELCFLFALPLPRYFLLLDITPHSPLCLSVCLSVHPSLSFLFVSVSLSNRPLDFCKTSTKRKYLCISNFFHIKKRGLELGGACLPHVEACWTKTNMILLNGWHFEKSFPCGLFEEVLHGLMQFVI